MLRILESPEVWQDDERTKGIGWSEATMDQNMLPSLVRSPHQPFETGMSASAPANCFAMIAAKQSMRTDCHTHAAQVRSATLGAVVMPHFYRDVDADLIQQVQCLLAETAGCGDRLTVQRRRLQRQTAY